MYGKDTRLNPGEHAVSKPPLPMAWRSPKRNDPAKAADYILIKSRARTI